MTVTPFDTTSVVAVLTGVLLPLVIALLRGKAASSRFAAIFAFVVCVVVAAIQLYLTKVILGGMPTTADGWARTILSDVIVVLFSAWLFYDKLWRPTLVVDALEERALQLGTPPPPRARPGAHHSRAAHRRATASTPDTSPTVERPTGPPPKP